jgi:hypothetical protein
MAETGHGRGSHCVHLWTADGSDKWVVNTRLRGVLEPVDEFEETDYEDDDYNEEWSDEEQQADDDENKGHDDNVNDDSTRGVAVSTAFADRAC